MDRHNHANWWPIIYFRLAIFNHSCNSVQRLVRMRICDEDKQLIVTINEQVRLLSEKGASETTIIETLFDFIPQVHCLINSSDEAELKMYLNEYTDFSYFIAMISNLHNIA